MRQIIKYADGYAFIKDGVEIAFYNILTDQYTFNSINCINCATISNEDLEWFRDILH